MKCPKCGTKISDKLIARHLASKGGTHSKRVITPDQQKKMQAARQIKKKQATQ
jgi:hypothetical protein